jgi:hypothetical protein
MRPLAGTLSISGLSGVGIKSSLLNEVNEVYRCSSDLRHGTTTVRQAAYPPADSLCLFQASPTHKTLPAGLHTGGRAALTKSADVIQCALQHRNNSPTQEAQPCEHHQHDQRGQKADYNFPARFRGRRSGFGRRIPQINTSEIIHFLIAF